MSVANAEFLKEKISVQGFYCGFFYVFKNSNASF